jgi:glycine hydroxymethyltransferase
MEQVAGFIAEAVANIGNDEKLAGIKTQVNAMMKRFPLYAGRLK